MPVFFQFADRVAPLLSLPTMAWSTAHSTWRGVGWNACFLGSLRGTEQ
ncbi:hypothetical protein SPURM210S_05076 [Streptomyces purpurascens]